VYEFPNKYKELLNRPNIFFVYYEPKKKGAGAYFGCGQIGNVVERVSLEEDEGAARQKMFVAEVINYRRFAQPVPLERENEAPREEMLHNSVREISPELYNEIVQAGGEEVSFQADAHLMRVLGEQLISSERVGILELIKNAYDAGASRCIVRIEKVPGLFKLKPDSDEWVGSQVGPVISVIDDGRGMDRDALLNGWLRPATTLKTQIKETLKTERERARERGTEEAFEALVLSLKKANGGRLPIGEKGVGRFATHRLGRKLLLLTKTYDDPLEWVLNVDWDRFDAIAEEGVDLAAVGLNLEHRTPTQDYGPRKSGTILKIYGGRPGFDWNEDKLKDIGRAIACLRSPRSGPEGFDVEYDCQHVDKGDLKNPLQLALAPFVCDAAVDESGMASVEIAFKPPPSLRFPMAEQKWSFDIDLRSKRAGYWHSGDGKYRVPRCGPFFLSVRCWLRRKEWIHGADWKEVTDYLSNFGGVDVYRDGLNVVSAQSGSERDWLELSTRHIKKGAHISYYNLSASVDLVQQDTPHLVDKTSREGLLDTVPYKDLSLLVQSVLEELELKVRETREDYERLHTQGVPGPEISKRHAGQLTRLLAALSSHYDFNDDPADLIPAIGKSDAPVVIIEGISDTIKQLRSSITQLEDQVEGLIEAAGFGLSIGVAIHEILKVTTSLALSAASLYRAVGKNSPFHEQLSTIKAMAESLMNEAKRISPLHVTRLEEASTFQVRDAILAAMGAFQMRWSDSSIDVPVPPRTRSFELTQQFGVCSQVFANLFDNATYWVTSPDNTGGARKICTMVDPDTRSVIVADSGPGIADRIRNHLFQPFYSLKSPPSGLGLYICKHYMTRMKGDIREARDTERMAGLDGAQFVIEFPREGRS
jgi:signal transduction histidine kinase